MYHIFTIANYSLLSSGNSSLICTLIVSSCVLDGGTFPGNVSNHIGSELEIDWKEKSFYEYSNDNCGKIEYGEGVGSKKWCGRH